MGRCRSTRCGNPNPTDWLLIGWGSWNQRAERVAPPGHVEVPPHTARIGSRHRIIDPSISLQPQEPEDGNGDQLGRYRQARCGNTNPVG